MIRRDFPLTARGNASYLMGMARTWSPSDRLGIVKPGVDAHTLGFSAVGGLLEEVGCEIVVAPQDVCVACDHPEGEHESALIQAWLRAQRVSILGFSYRLGPEEGVDLLARLVRMLERASFFADQGGAIHSVHVAALPATCRRAREKVARVTETHLSDDEPEQTLAKLGIRSTTLPRESAAALAYDRARLEFGRDLVRRGDFRALPPPDRSGYPEYGTERDTLRLRLAHASKVGALPLMRAHFGRYQQDREQAVRQFMAETRELARGGHLDILSIGTSQLSQERFGEVWGDAANGGGVPLNSEAELRQAWAAARPMLVRTYAGTRDIPALARVYESTLHIAWHTLSLWWFCRIDNRGPNDLAENLRQHGETLRYIASVGTPFEPNVPHHFAFRGGDEVTYVVSAYVAARWARTLGIRTLVAQNMLNTPRAVWGVQDLARSRVLLELLRSLEGPQFQVHLQPRAGLDYLSGDLEKARAQLAAVTALMDDIEPENPGSPPIIHVLSYTEADRLADPAVIGESVQITRAALRDWRALRARGEGDHMGRSGEVAQRAADLGREARALIAAMEREIADPWSARGLYQMMARGWLVAPYLWDCREELGGAVNARTRLVRGAVREVDERGVPLPIEERIRRAAAWERV